jgi:hypothetical protein
VSVFRLSINFASPSHSLAPMFITFPTQKDALDTCAAILKADWYINNSPTSAAPTPAIIAFSRRDIESLVVTEIAAEAS